MTDVHVKPSQMIRFSRGGWWNIHAYFGDPVDMQKVLNFEIGLLKQGIPTKVQITGRPYVAFFNAYKPLRDNILTVTQVCRHCDGKGHITTKQGKVWDRCQLYAFKGSYFAVPERCEYCEGHGYQEFFVKKISNI